MSLSMPLSQNQNRRRAVETFHRHFSYSPQDCFRAPGRVNLIGEHTDYNDGFVLPCAIGYDAVVAISPRDDQTIRAIACDHGEQLTVFNVGRSIERSANSPWSDYLRGVVVEFQKAFPGLSGFDLTLTGNVPAGAGLSSSAAYEVVVATALNDVFQAGLAPTALAQMAQRAENDFVGCRCGIMDQLISALGQSGRAALIDCRSLAMTHVAMPGHWRILVIDSRVKRGLVESEYNMRRSQCEQAAAAFGVDALRDLTPDDLLNETVKLDPVTFRRARHVVTENQRTLAAADALSRGDLSTMSTLMRQSHESMRDDFEITVPEIDFLVHFLDRALGDKGGVRMTGGGFGGCVVALVPDDVAGGLSQAVGQAYQERTGVAPGLYLCHAVSGACRLDGVRHA